MSGITAENSEPLFEFVNPLIRDVRSHLPLGFHVVIPLKSSSEHLDLSISLNIRLLPVFTVRSTRSPIIAPLPLRGDLIALFVIFIVLALTSFATVIEHAILIMAEVNFAVLGRMEGTSTVIALALITVKPITSFHIDLLLQIEVMFQTLILELLIQVLVMATVDVVHDLLLKVSLILNRHGLSTCVAIGPLFELTCPATVCLSGLARSTATGAS